MLTNPFAMQKLEEILELANQQPRMAQLTTPQQSDTQEPITGQQMVDEKINQALNPRSAPNQWEIDKLRDIGGSKALWHEADLLSQNPSVYAKVNGLTDDQVLALAEQRKQAAHAAAEMARYQLNAAGMNTNGYSAFDDTLENVGKNLASREAQDITEALQGAYSKNANQYYEEVYRAARAKGFRPDAAERIAGTKAREYQANRVAYLNGVFNSYGIGDDGTTNRIGTQILGMMAMENPMLANLYGQVYPNQRDAYSTNQQIAMEALKHGNLLDIIDKNFANTLKQMGVADMYNAQQQYRGGEIYRQNTEYSHILEMQKELGKYQFDLDKEYQKQLAISQKDAAEYEQKVYRADAWAQALGLQPGTPEYAAFVIENIGGKAPESLAKSKDKAFERASDTYKMLQKEEEAILKLLSDTNLTEDQMNGYKDRLTQIQNAKQSLWNMIEDYHKLPGSTDIPSYTGNAEKDKETAMFIISQLGEAITRDQIVEELKNWIHKTNETGKEVPDWAIEKWVDEELGIAKTQTTEKSQNNGEKKHKVKNYQVPIPQTYYSPYLGYGQYPK